MLHKFTERISVAIKADSSTGYDLKKGPLQTCLKRQEQIFLRLSKQDSINYESKNPKKRQGQYYYTWV